MGRVKFSVVIPTRERAATLRYALRTCLDQDFDGYEIVVSDNHSSPATRAVVDEAADPRIRYVRTPEPLAMSSNWDFGVAHARGEYVLLIGDDDGLLPHCLRELDRFSRRHPGRVLRWEPVYYTWPDFALPGQADYLRVPMGCDLAECDAMKIIASVIGFGSFYTALPMFYNAMVPRSVIAELTARAGRVFPHPVPDVYSGFAVAAVCGSYFSTEVPMTVAGQSGASNGIATLFNRGRNPIDGEYRRLNAREGLRSDPRVPDLPAFPHVPVADAFAYAKRIFFPDSPIDFDARQFVAGCVANLRVATEAEWAEALRQLRASLADDPDLLAWFDAEYAGTPYRWPQPLKLRPDRSAWDGDYLHLNAAEFGVRDVAGAATLCERLLRYREHGIEFFRSPIQKLRFELAERARVIAELDQACRERLQQIQDLHARLVAASQGGRVRRLLRRIKRHLLALLGRATAGVRT